MPGPGDKNWERRRLVIEAAAKHPLHQITALDVAALLGMRACRATFLLQDMRKDDLIVRVKVGNPKIPAIWQLKSDDVEDEAEVKGCALLIRVMATWPARM